MKMFFSVKYLLGLMCSSSDGDYIYVEFEKIYYAVSYVNPKTRNIIHTYVEK